MLSDLMFGLGGPVITAVPEGQEQRREKRLVMLFGKEAAQKIKRDHEAYVEGLEKRVLSKVTLRVYGDEALKHLQKRCPELFE